MPTKVCGSKWPALLRVLAWAVCLAGGYSSIAHAQPRIEYLSPPVIQRGVKSTITVYGTDLEGAFGIWTSLPSGPLPAKVVREKIAATVELPSEQQVSFEVAAPADAPLGLYGLRVATPSGLSNVHIFLIDELPVQVRQYPRAATDSHPPASPTALTEQPAPLPVKLPACVAGVSQQATSDIYRIDVAQGERVSFEVIGNRFGKDFDPLVTIRDAAGTIVAEEDNDGGLFFDCRFEHTFAQPGKYTVEVRDARYWGDNSWRYVLRMGDFPVARVAVPAAVTLGATPEVVFPQVPDLQVPVKFSVERAPGWQFQEVRAHARGVATWIPILAISGSSQTAELVLEQEPNNLADTANEASTASLIHGVLQTPGDIDAFRLTLTKGQTIVVRGEARALGSPADLELILLEPNGNEVKRIDDLIVRDRRDSWPLEAHFDFTARQDGPHALLVRDVTSGGGPAYAYQVEVTPGKAQLKLEAEVARVTLPQANYQPIPLKLTRMRCSGPVELKLLGAPAGVTLEPSVIPAEATEVVCQLRAANAAALGLYTLRILAEWKPAEGVEGTPAKAYAETLPLIDRRTRNKDLIPLALRDNQLYPPPSLTNRLALQITPPAPFDVQLPDETILMTKYLLSGFAIHTPRQQGFASPISFTAAGGQIGNEDEERTNIFLRFPTATAEQSEVRGEIHNRILTQYEKFRVDLNATAPDGDRKVTLHRTFMLDVKSAFAPAFEPANLELMPGETATVRVLANRTSEFNGPVRLETTTSPGIDLEEAIEIAADQGELDYVVKVPAQTSPGRYSMRFKSTGIVGKYEEEINGPTLNVTVKLPPAEKKKP